MSSTASPGLFDTHCHLDFECWAGCVDEVVARSKRSGLVGMVVPATTRDSWARVHKLSRECAGFVYPAYGLHPYFVESHVGFSSDVLRKWLERSEHSAVAIGEIGLDKFCPDFARQEYLFCQQLELVTDYNLPVILHVRKAHDRVLELLKNFGVRSGIVHAFSGSEQLAMRYIEQGFHLGIGVGITWPGSKKIRLAAGKLPLERLCLETDSPDMAMVGRQKGSGDPADVVQVFASLCELRKETSDELAERLLNNSRELFSIPVLEP